MSGVDQMTLRSFVIGLVAPAVAAFLLGACSSSPLSFGRNEPPPVDENAFPSNYRAAVLKIVTNSQAYDPTNIREAAISEPALKSVGGTPRYVACVRFNARNMNRQYAGLTEYAAYFFGGDLNQFVKSTGDVCAGAAYAPFPELEKICLGTKCT